MTDDIPEGVKTQFDRTRRARETFEKFATDLEAVINGINPGGLAVFDLPKDIQSICANFKKTLKLANEEESELAKQCQAFSGVIQGGALDLEAARTEIIGRVARLRERERG